MTALDSGSAAVPAAVPAATGVVAPAIDIDTTPALAFAHNTQFLRQSWPNAKNEAQAAKQRSTSEAM
jgi:hypothetical protein